MTGRKSFTKYWIAATIIFGTIFNLKGQNGEDITIGFEHISLEEALLELEEISQLTFFYDDSWLEDHFVTKSYDNMALDDILDDLFDHTSINYFRTEDRIILLSNSAIHLALPQRYFDTANTSEEEAISAPLFREEFVSETEEQKREIITIGKQDLNRENEFFVLAGQVTKKNTGEPIFDLSISTSDRSIYAATDTNGFYEITLPAGYNELETHLLGFEKIFQEVLLIGDGSLNLEIEEDVEILDEVVVRSNRDANVRDAVIGAATVDVEAIKTIPLVLGERDILKVATTLPGITTAGEGSSGLNVRGGRADQNLVLLDNAVIYNPSHFLGFFSALNPFTTKGIDIYKASIPAEFGGRLSSVFDIEAKSGSTEKLTGQGSVGPVTANLALETPIVKEKSSLTAGIRMTYADYILNNLNEESLRNSEASFYDALLKYSHNIDDKNSIQGTFYYSKDKFSITSDSLFSYNNKLFSLKWNHNFYKKSWLSVIMASSQYQYDILFDAEANGDFSFGYILNENLLKINANKILNGGHRLTYGASGKLYVTDPGAIAPLGPDSDVREKAVDREKGVESAVYLSDLVELNDRLLLDVGIRYSLYGGLGTASQNVYAEGIPRNESSVIEVKHFKNNEVIKTFGGFEYRVSGRYLLRDDLSLKLGFNRTLQYIHLLTTNTTVSPTDIWKLSDLNIRPQKADQLSLGIFKNIISKDMELSIEGYYKKMNDLLDYKIGAQLILNDELETELLQGNGKAYGIEFLIKKSSGRLNGHLGYTYSRALIRLNSTIREEQVNNGDFFPANFDKPHDLSFISNYRFTKRLSASVNFIYQTGRPITYPVGKYFYADEEQVLYSDRNQFRIPDYYRLDLGVNIEGSHKKKKLAHSFINISVYNLLGRNNPYSVFFVSEGGRIKAYKTSIFSIPVPTLTYNFKF